MLFVRPFHLSDVQLSENINTHRMNGLILLEWSVIEKKTLICLSTLYLFEDKIHDTQQQTI